jgi:predicted DNA-binding transcriptional regulator AlpA
MEALEKDVAVAVELRTEVGKDLAHARADLADYIGQQQAPQPNEIGEKQTGWTQFEISATRAKIQDLEGQDRQLMQYLNTKGPQLEDLRRRRDAIEAELNAARADEEVENAKLSDVQSTAAARGVRLRVLDPGIVPQRPSFPNPPLNLAVALALSLIASIGYLALRFAYERTHSMLPDAVFPFHSDALR